MAGEDQKDVEVNLKKLLHQIASEQGFKDYKLQVTPISSGGANFSSILYTAKIEDKQNAINLFIKVAIMTPELAAQMGIEKSIFDGERYFYSNVSKIFKDIEAKHNVPEEDTFILPKYYGAIMEKSKEILVLEDLAAKGFTTYDRSKSIDWPYASASVKELAKFHAISMAFEKEYPEIYEKFIDKYFTNFYTVEVFKTMLLPSFNLSVQVVREENRDKLKKFLDNIKHADILKMYQPVKKKVLIHTDYRTSNLMHRYREDGSIQVIPLDYQTFQNGCPVSDLIYFVFIGSDEEFRRQHFDQLVEHYYTELSAAMTRLGVDNSRYSREDFDQDLKEKLKYGLVMASQYLPVVTVDPKEAPIVTENISAFAQIKTSEEFVSRMNGVVDDFVRWGIL